MSPSANPSSAARNRGGPESVWRTWMREFGHHVRRVRAFLGLSQEELARRAGVSQGAISRFESGRGLHTPFLVILKINLALAAALRATDPAMMSDDVRRFLQHMDFLVPRGPGEPPTPGGVPFPELRVTRSLQDEWLVRLYLGVPEPRRPAFLAIVEAAAKALEG
jgi:transcriptional regulator with XRE-family HTH domain